MRPIDADALLIEFQKAQDTMYRHGREYSYSFLNSAQEISTEWYAVEYMVENAPTIEERKTGKWIDDNCSVCGQYVHHGDARNYCPRCGAKMENGDD